MQVSSLLRAALRSRLLCAISVVIAIIANLTIVHAQTPIAGVTAQATSTQQTASQQPLTAQVLTTNVGLTETAPGSGVFQLNTNPYIFPEGSVWTSDTIPSNSSVLDQNPYVQFDLGATYTVNKFHVWNCNATDGYNVSGFRDTTIQYSLNGTTWKTVAQRFRFVKGPGLDTYTGEDYFFTYPISARYIRFQADNTWQIEGGIYTGRAALGKVRFYAGGTVTTPVATGGIFPSDSGVVNVKFPPYNAKGDGVADDTAAIQQAINDWQGTMRTIYLPAGRYLISDSLKLAVREKDTARFGGGFTVIRGESITSTVIRLADNTFTDPANPKPILSAANNSLPGGGISADWFNNNFGNMIVDAGFGNPGAIGVQFYANNVGAIRDMVIKSEDGQGVAALDFAYADQNGPMYAKNITTQGFKIGVRMATAVNGLTLEDITVNNPTVLGVANNGQCVSIQNLKVTGPVTALQTRGVLSLIGATLTGGGAGLPAIINDESLYARSVNTSGYAQAIQNNYGDNSSFTGPNVSEYVSQTPLRQFSTRPKSLTLPLKTTPEAPQDTPSVWANVRNFRLISDPDDTLSIQRAIDSGATTVYFPGQGTYYLSGKVYVRNNVRRILGMFSRLRRMAIGVGFQVEAGTNATVWIENFLTSDSLVEVINNSSRTLVCRNLQDLKLTPQGTGDWLVENVAADQLNLNGQKFWARQLNIEYRGTKINNNGGTLWILGMKTENGGTLIKTTGGGKSELLGGLYYTQFGNEAPMFVIEEANASFSVGEVNYTSDPFQILVVETRGGITRSLTKSQTPQRRYDPGSMLPLYVGYTDATYLAPPFNIQATGGDRSISLTWDAMPGAISYTVRRATSPTGSFTTLGTVTTTGYANTNLTAGATYYYTVTTTYSSGTSAQSNPVGATANTILRLNSGGIAAGLFTSDAFFTGGTPFRSDTPIDVSGVTNPAPQGVYQSERYGNFSYVLPNLTPGASYKLRLHFAELYFTAPGQRVFSVAINGAPALTNFDIVATAGAANKAIVREFTTTADTNGKITLDFTSTVDSAKINGIELILL